MVHPFLGPGGQPHEAARIHYAARQRSGGWPVATRAQQSERMRRIGVLMNNAADDPEGQARLAAFPQELPQLGWTAGRNVRIDCRWPAGDNERLRRGAAELVALASDVTVVSSPEVVAALIEASRTVPVVFTNVPDPVGPGFVDSLARPGGNVTGFMLFEFGLSGKWLELLKQIAPQTTRVALIRDPTAASGSPSSVSSRLRRRRSAWK